MKFRTLLSAYLLLTPILALAISGETVETYSCKIINAAPGAGQPTDRRAITSLMRIAHSQYENNTRITFESDQMFVLLDDAGKFGIKDATDKSDAYHWDIIKYGQYRGREIETHVTFDYKTATVSFSERRYTVFSPDRPQSFARNETLVAGNGRCTPIRVVLSKTTSAFVAASGIANQVGKYIQNNRSIPTSLDQVGVKKDYPGTISDISIDGETGWLQVKTHIAEIDDKSFFLAPSFNEYGEVEWRCVKGEIIKDFLPEQCKYDTSEALRMPKKGQ